jgi:hypothetical protein
LILGTNGRGIAREEDTKSSKAKTEILLIGPLSLGKLYDNRPDKRSLGDAITDGKGPSELDISEALKACEVFIIDKKYESRTGEWKFCDSQFPRITVGGGLEVKLKIDDKKDFKLYLARLARVATSTNYVEKPPTRTFHLGIEFEIVVGDTWSGELSRYGVEFPRITYDLTGKIVSKK